MTGPESSRAAAFGGYVPVGDRTRIFHDAVPAVDFDLDDPHLVPEWAAWRPPADPAPAAPPVLMTDADLAAVRRHIVLRAGTVPTLQDSTIARLMRHITALGAPPRPLLAASQALGYLPVEFRDDQVRVWAYDSWAETHRSFALLTDVAAAERVAVDCGGTTDPEFTVAAVVGRHLFTGAESW